MGEFNGKKLYGYAMETDPDLIGQTWNTKNFEFSVVRPETVQRAIEKVNIDGGASLKQKQSNLLNKLREKCGDGQNNAPCPNRDADIETQISQFVDIDAKSVMTITDEEGGYSGNSNQTLCDEEYEPTYSHNERSKGGEDSFDPCPIQKAVVQEIETPQPKWVEISEPRLASMQVFDLNAPLPMPPLAPPFSFGPNMFQIPYQFMPPTPQMMNLGFPFPQQQPMMENFPYQNPYEDYNPNPHLIEDSDLEDEMVRREHYTKFIQKRADIKEARRSNDEGGSCAEFVNIAPQEPYTDMSYLKNTIPMRYSEVSDEEAKENATNQHPKVVIKSRKPQTKESTTGSTTKVLKKSPQKKEQKKEKREKKEATTADEEAFARLVAQERLIANQIKAQPPKAIAKKPKKPYQAPAPARVNRKPQSQTRTQSDRNLGLAAEIERINLMVSNGKSLELLKAEKGAIFNKMSRTHERLIDALEQLKTKLLEVYIPESTSDRNRRNRNGFEFSVRFLRNFLYPLKGMIDTMRNTPKEQFNSIKTNDACKRVGHIYSLFLQAVFTYSKQLRHFMIDQVPQKLTTLLEMLYSTTTMCLEKRLFDRNDAIVECLINHCSDFLTFLEDLHAQRFVAAARGCYRKVNVQNQSSKFDLKMFMNDLNMYEPKLVPKRSITNTRPRIIRKFAASTNGSNNANAINAARTSQAVKQPARRSRKRVMQSKNLFKAQEQQKHVANRSSSEIVNQPVRVEENIRTQVQNWNQRSSEVEKQDSHEVLMSLQNIIEKTPNLKQFQRVEMINRSILNALKNTKQQKTRDILQPLLQTIDSAMDIPENDNEIENILEAFQMKISILLKGENFQHGNGKASGMTDNKTAETQHYSQQYKDDMMTYEDLDEQYKCNGELSKNEPNNNPEPEPEGQNICAEEDFNVDDDDDDGQFYISGFDCSSKKPIRARKTKLEPLIEIVDENEAAELFSSDTELYAPFRPSYNSKKQYQLQNFDLDLFTNPPKPYSYDIPLSRRSTKSPKTGKSPANSHQPQAKKSSNKIVRNQPPVTSKPPTSRCKTTTIPPSPAMMRLKQRAQPLVIDCNKKNNLLKKATRRNPMGSPPPPPTVSPSTSVACTPSIKSTDFPALAGHNTSSSLKGCTSNMGDHEAHSSSSKLSQQMMTQPAKESDVTLISNNSSRISIQKKSSGRIIETIKMSCESLQRGINDNIEPTANLGNGGDGDCKASESNESRKPKDCGCGDQNCNPSSSYNQSNAMNPERIEDTNLNPCQNNIDEEKECDKEKPRVHFDAGPIVKERDQYLSECIRNRLYTNPNYATPWRILSRLSQQLARDVLKDVESDFNTNVMKFVDDFLKLEMRI